jgi:hypothetical protein
VLNGADHRCSVGKVGEYPPSTLIVTAIGSDCIPGVVSCLMRFPYLSYPILKHSSYVDLRILMTKKKSDKARRVVWLGSRDSLELVVVIQQNNLCKPFHLSIPYYRKHKNTFKRAHGFSVDVDLCYPYSFPTNRRLSSLYIDSCVDSERHDDDGERVIIAESWTISTWTMDINRTRGTSEKEIVNEIFNEALTCLKSVDFDGAIISIQSE